MRHLLAMAGLAALAVGIGAQPAAAAPPLLLQHPSMSATRIAFDYAGEIWTVPRDGGAAQRLVTGQGLSSRPIFSPDGKWIAYTLRHDGKNDVHLFELATSRDLALTSDGQSWNPAFAPDATQLAFLRSVNFTIDLWVMDLGNALTAGTAPKGMQRITNGEGVDGANRPSWGR